MAAAGSSLAKCWDRFWPRPLFWRSHGGCAAAPTPRRSGASPWRWWGRWRTWRFPACKRRRVPAMWWSWMRGFSGRLVCRWKAKEQWWLMLACCSCSSPFMAAIVFNKRLVFFIHFSILIYCYDLWISFIVSNLL